MFDPSDLLTVARQLSDASAERLPTEAHIRRAISTAYYALFHKILGAGAQRFMGSGQEQSAGYALIYRGFEHRRMREVCIALDVSTLSAKFRFNLGKDAVSRDMRDFANTFVDLQRARHLADYHPIRPFSPSDVSSLIVSAEDGMAAFDRTSAEEQADVLALLMVGARD